MINKSFTVQNRKIRKVENGSSLLQKKKVDINILLNRVRIDKKR